VSGAGVSLVFVRLGSSRGRRSIDSARFGAWTRVVVGVTVVGPLSGLLRSCGVVWCGVVRCGVVCSAGVCCVL
jgi:hypothetical protein